MGWQRTPPDIRPAPAARRPPRRLRQPRARQPPQPAPGTSCADLLQAGEQHLLINDWIASVIGAYAYKLLHRQPIHTFATFTSLDAISTRSLRICRAELLACLPEEE